MERTGAERLNVACAERPADRVSHVEHGGVRRDRAGGAGDRRDKRGDTSHPGIPDRVPGGSNKLSTDPAFRSTARTSGR